MELSQVQIIQKPNKQRLSSFFTTHRLNVLHAPVKFHKYIPYGLGVMARTRIGTDVRMYVRDRRTGVTLNYPLISCPLCKSKSFWNIFMILVRNVEHDQTTCCVQEWQHCLYYFWRYLPFLCLTVIIHWFRARIGTDVRTYGTDRQG